MNLIHFRGLNCYLNCIISIAASHGVKYTDSLATLWSEIDFAYNPTHDVYSTKRMLQNLEIMGVQLEGPNCASEEEIAGDLCRLQEGDLTIIGMDAFHIPWSPIYQALHDPHYFFMQKEQSGLFVCFDPTYNRQHMRIRCDDLAPYAYDIFHVGKIVPKPLRVENIREAQETIHCLPHIRERLLGEIDECAQEKQKNAVSLGKYVEALINNRYLYKHYLQATGPDKYQQFFAKDFFARWEGVKNGLFKASLIGNNEGVLHEVSKLLESLLGEEVVMAKQMMDRVSAADAFGVIPPFA